MVALAFTDHRADPAAWAASLGVSREAVELHLASDVIDLHIDSFIWTRIFGYDLTKRHGHGLFGARYMSQSDVPRLREAAVTGGIWVITTNPLRTASSRARIFAANLARLRSILASCEADVAVVRNAAEYRAARSARKHAAWIGIQGGNALDYDEAALDAIPDDLVVRITVVHLSTSKLGETSAPKPFGSPKAGLSTAGKDFVRRLNARKIFVDLAHISRRGFFEAVDVHDKSQPLIVTHTGVSGVYPHWRNIDDEQLRAVADTGGTIGVMYQQSFLGNGAVTADTIVDHLAHIVKTVGDDHASLGSDWDGMIVTPRDMPTCLELPRLVDAMLRRGWRPDRVRKILGGSYLRALGMLRG